MSRSWRSVALGALAALILVLLGYRYLAPASGLALAGDTSYLLSEGGDANTAPLHHWVIQRLLRENPSYLLYGTVYTPQLNPPAGFGLWIPWIERIVEVVFGSFFTVEGMATVYPWVLMVLNGWLTYLFGRREGWPWGIALAAGICFAFNPFTRARSIAHDSLVGLFYVPAVFLGLQALRSAEAVHALPRKKIAGAAGWLLLAATAAHYYIMITVAIAPFLLWYALRGQATKRRSLARLAIASIPAILFLAWNVLAPLPSEVSNHQAVHQPPIATSWLVTFAARPIDYLSGDIAFDASDWNPIRSSITQSVRARGYDGSNNLERANGIRWLVLALFAAGILSVFGKRDPKRFAPAARSEIVFFAALAVGAFWLSLSPRSIPIGAFGIGPSLWVHQILPHFRVPSRFGPIAHFACLIVAGHWLANWLRARPRPRGARLAVLALAPALAFLEFYPVHPVWAIAAQPDRRELVLPDPDQGGDHCGFGVFFPYVGVRAGSMEEFEFYKAIQQMKRTPCLLGNLPLDDASNARLYERIGAERFARDPSGSTTALVSYLLCSGAEWVVFRGETPRESRKEICGALGWKRTADDSCRSPRPIERPIKILECL